MDTICIVYIYIYTHTNTSEPKIHSLKVNIYISDKMASLQLPGQEKPFSFLQHEGCVVCCQLCCPSPAPLVSYSSLTLGASAKTHLTILYCCPLHGSATTSLTVYSHPSPFSATSPSRYFCLPVLSHVLLFF